MATARSRRNHRDRRIRAPIDWGARLKIWLRSGSILLLAMFFAVVAVKSSVAEVFHRSRPARALAWQPTHASASANMAHRLIAADRAADARQLAIASIARDPTRANAYSALALVAEQAGDEQQALRLMGLSNAMSRREPLTQAWFLRRSIQSGDFAAAVRHFDISMRTSERRSANLMPLLVTATVDPRMLPPLQQILDRDPPWKVHFLQDLAIRGPSPDNVARLSQNRLDPGDVGERPVLSRLIQRFVDDRRFDLGWSFYRQARPGTPEGAAAMLRDPQFAGASGFPPFDWQLTDQPDLTALREARRDGGQGFALALIADGRTGEVASQLVRLAPGLYRLQFETGAVPAQAVDRPQVTLSCASGSSPFYSVRPERAGEAPQRVQGLFTVPSECRWQWLAVRIGSTETPVAFPWVANITIRRVS